MLGQIGGKKWISLIKEQNIGPINFLIEIQLKYLQRGIKFIV